MNYKISVIIPIYNSEKYLERCLDSIVNQTYKNLEIILLNDGSTDKSEEICKRYSDKDERIIYISKKNTGVSSTRNLGLEHVTGDYISFIDSDDFVELNMYEDLIELLEKNPKVDTILTDLTVVWNNEFIKSTKENKTFLLTRDEVFNNITKGYKFQGYSPTKLYNSKIVLDNNIKFDEKIYMVEDLLFFVEYLNYTKYILYTNQSYYYYIKHGDNVTLNYSPKRLTIIDAYDKIINLIPKTTDININNYFEQYFDQVFGLFMRLKEINAPTEEVEKTFGAIAKIPYSNLNRGRKIKKYILINFTNIMYNIWKIKTSILKKNSSDVLKN